MVFPYPDIHIDSNYIANSDPDQWCHRKNSKSSKNTAGQFGALGSECDTPVPLVSAITNFFSRILVPQNRASALGMVAHQYFCGCKIIFNRRHCVFVGGLDI